VLLFDYDEFVTHWVMAQIPHGSEPRDATAIGVVQNGMLIAGVVYYDHTPTGVSMATAGYGNWLTRNALEVFFGHAFYPTPLGMGKRRVSSLVHKANKTARKFNERIGFKREGSHPEVFPDGGAISYGMLKRDCKWIDHEHIRKR
jgi:RimJ/RimL family protein N-acetyltransferase